MRRLSQIVIVLIFVIAFAPNAHAQVCYERLPGQSCCWNATPPMAILFCDDIQCNPLPVTDPVISIVIPGAWHINPTAWPAVAPAPTCIYRDAKCIDQDPPCGWVIKTTSTTCPSAVTATT